MAILELLRKDMFAAQKEGNSAKAEILQMAMASLKNEQIAKGEELTEADETRVLRKEIKKLQDALSQYEAAGRDDLAAKEKAQLEVMQSYVPELMDESGIEQVVEAKIKELGAESMRDMGRVMGVVMKELEGKADGAVVKELVSKKLQ